jgi:hypothetical protein
MLAQQRGYLTVVPASRGLLQNPALELNCKTPALTAIDGLIGDHF